MDCEICCRTEGDEVDFLCAGCARASVYLCRLDQARILLENEKLSRQVTEVVGADSTKGSQQEKSKHTTPASCLWQKEMVGVQSADIKAKTQMTKTQMDEMRKEIEEMKECILQKRMNNKARQNVLNNIKQKLSSSRPAHESTLTQTQSRYSTLLDSLNNKSVSSKASMCREVATLMRLRQKRREKNGVMREQYFIAGLMLPDFQEINSLRCSDLTAVLGSLSHLLMLIAFYLGVRLPAEITESHRDYPLPTINTPANSYLGRKVDFPGSSVINPILSTNPASKDNLSNPHRPRPLFVGSDDKDEKIRQFAQRDPAAFNFFIEGISLLAWNIAWLCRSQGATVGTNTWEEICNTGRNLWHLILAPPQPPAILRLASDRNTQKRPRQTRQTSTPLQELPAETSGRLGQSSHASAHSFLGKANSIDVSRGWRYANFNIVSDSLRKMLITEMNNAEWELLQEQEWDDGGEKFDEADIVRTRALDGREYDDARSILTNRASAEGQVMAANRVPGTSGWTKLKSREKP